MESSVYVVIERLSVTRGGINLQIAAHLVGKGLMDVLKSYPNHHTQWAVLIETGVLNKLVSELNYQSYLSLVVEIHRSYQVGISIIIIGGS